jgi:uncharacterized coiled-coil protein SlyX
MNGWRYRVPPVLALAAALGPGCDRSEDLEIQLATERRQHADALRVRDDQIAQFSEVIEKLTADIRSLRKEIDALRKEGGGAAAAEKKPDAGPGPAPATTPAPAAARPPASAADGPAIQNQRAAIALLLAENVELRSRLLAIARERSGTAPADPLPDPLTFPLSSVEEELARIHHALTVLQERMQTLERR